MHVISEWLNYLGIPPTAALGTVVIPIIAAIVIVVITRTLRRVLGGVRSRIHMHPNAEDIITRVIGTALWICAGLLLINAWGVSVSGLWTVLVSILTAIALAFGGVSLTSPELIKMLGMTIVGSVSFASMGLLLALLVPANAAPAIVNLIYLPMSFLSGLWMPLRFMPHWLQGIAPALPTYHLSQLMLSIFGYQDSMSLAVHWNALIGFTLLMLGLAWLIFHRREQNA